MELVIASLILIVLGGCSGSEYSAELLEKGRMQYQLLQDRGRLPKYGACWTQAIERIEQGCSALTEHTQSDMALRMTNCFLEMSGHEPYNCELDKKPNLRGICISTMSDRAFNVYTEFYTHAQNICWFLQGQAWQEMIAESTRKVGRELEKSATTQAELRQKLTEYGTTLDGILGGFVATLGRHEEALRLIAGTVGGLQSWLIGEVSWLDSIIFYISSAALIMFLTASPRTSSARLPCFALLACTLFLERLVCKKMMYTENIYFDHNNYYTYIWYLRYVFMALVILALTISVYIYKDYAVENNLLLHRLAEQFAVMHERLESPNRSIETRIDCDEFCPSTPYENLMPASRCKSTTPRRKLLLTEVHGSGRYNLRSRTGTPDVI